METEDGLRGSFSVRRIHWKTTNEELEDELLGSPSFCGTLVFVSMDIEMKNMQKEPVEGGDSSKSF